ncbi:hypothetical protein [Reyranella sp.]|uniref:hypothetical protein n=1 Tax=Reyranella sp. TaxID=1929291 RepID=UPI003C7D2A03
MKPAPEFAQPKPSLQQDAQRAWAIKRLHDERSMDRLAAVQTFDTLCTLNPNPRLRRLCETITYGMFPEVARPQPDVEPFDGVVAR